MIANPLSASAARFPGVPAKCQSSHLRWCWRYLSVDGREVLGIVARYDKSDGGKDYLPMFLPDSNGTFNAGYPERKDEKRPLFGLHTIQVQEPVYIVEGERCAAALHALDFAAVCCPGGANAARYADWTPLNSVDHFVVLPDNDPPGAKYAETVASILSAFRDAPRIEVCELPELPEKGDVCDWLEVGVFNWDGFAPDPLGTVDGLADELRDSIGKHAAEYIPQDTTQKKTGRQFETVCIADVRREEVLWRWPGYLPCGKLIILDGDPGVGKSSITMDWAARVSNGDCFPGTVEALPAADVLIIAVEDGLADTVRPRLEAAGADLERIHAPKPGEYPTLPGAANWMRRFIEAHGVGLVIVDPIMAMLGGMDTHKDNDTRQALTPLAGVADATGASVVIVRHLNKAQGARAIHKGGGSIAFTAAARVVLTAGRTPDGSGNLALAVAKCNLAGHRPALYYTLHEVGGAPRIEWGEVAPFDADALVTEPNQERGDIGAKNEAQDFLRVELADGPLPVKEIKQRAEDAGIAQRTLDRAKAELGVSSLRTGGIGESGHWVWSLPEPKIANDG